MSVALAGDSQVLRPGLSPCGWGADDVEVTGVVIRQWGRDMPGARLECTLAFMANHLTQLRAQKAALQVARSPPLPTPTRP